MRLRLASLLTACWALAFALRLRWVDSASVGSDAMGQYLRALAAWRGAWPTPPNPEGGHSLWVWVAPLLPVADSLQSLIGWRYALASVVAPAAAAAAFALSPRGGARWSAAAFAGVAVACDPGLADTLGVAFRGYGAPELIGLATLGVAICLRGWRGGPALVVLTGLAALGQHPMAAGMAVGWLAALLVVRPRIGWRPLVVALLVGGVCMLPRLAYLWRLTGCGDGALVCLSRIASGSSEPDVGPWAMVARAWHDRFVVDLGPAAWALGVGCVAALYGRDDGARGRWSLVALVVCGGVGVVALGLSIHSLRPYHLRALAVPIAALAGVGLARVWPVALLGAMCVAWAWVPVSAPGPSPGAVALADSLAARIGTLDGPVRVDGAWFGRPVGLEPAPVVLSAVLAGQDPDRFRLDAHAQVVLMVSGEGFAVGGADEWDRGEGWTVLRFDDLNAARRWIGGQVHPPDRLGGAWDWASAVHPDGADLAAANW